MSDVDLNEMLGQMLMVGGCNNTSTSREDDASATREKRITTFNDKADAINTMRREVQRLELSQSSKESIGKADSADVPLSTMQCIPLARLHIGKTHSGSAVYCRIVSKIYHSVSAMVLVEDESALMNLAVYGSIDRSELREGRLIVIKEPFFKIRADGSQGIRVDNPADLIFDVPKPSSSNEASTLVKPKIEERLQKILEEDSTIGVDKLYNLLSDEGYSIKKKRLRAIKKSMTEGKSEDTASGVTEKSYIPIISERQPETHLVIKVKKVSELKQEGNRALKSKSYSEAERLYTEALKEKDGETDNSVEEVYLWQLYSNRSAVRMMQGKLHESLEDSLLSNIHSPAEEVKPLLRCSEALVRLGLHQEARNLFEAMKTVFPHALNLIEEKEAIIFPKQTLRVGKDSTFTTINKAIRYATSGTEILIEPGTYKESLIIDKPLTLRCISSTINDFSSVDYLEGINTAEWVEVDAVDTNAIVCIPEDSLNSVHIIGFKVSCKGSPFQSYHSIYVHRGVAVLRNCIFTSTSGPVVAVDSFGTSAILQGCAVHSGVQGGILGADRAMLSLHQVHCCKNAASGFEVRENATASLHGCQIYDNGKQGIISWCGANSLTAKDCEIYSNTKESGILVEESNCLFANCKVYGNNIAGIVCQNKGNMRLYKCDVYLNHEGILVQESGSAYIERCVSHSNQCNGIFVGYDHVGSAVIIENKVNDNRFRGILIGCDKNVVSRDNEEQNNLGLPPVNSAGGITGAGNTKGVGLDRAFLKRMKKNKKHIRKASEQTERISVFDSLLGKCIEEDVLYKGAKGAKKMLNQCAFCNAKPPKVGPSFCKCSRCKEISYCSAKCQKLDWPQHKKVCRDKSIKYPSFIDKNKSV